MNKLTYIFIIVFFSYLSSFSQSKNQKEEIFKGVESYLNAKYFNKEKTIGDNLSIDTFYIKASILPVKKFNYRSKTFTNNNDNYYILFEKKVYIYNNKSVSLLFDCPFTKRLDDLIKNDKTIYIGYLFDSKITKEDIFISNDKVKFIEDFYGEKYSNMESFILNETGSINKFNEINNFYTKQSSLTVKNINEAIKNNYHLYEGSCPKDTSLVVNTFISQLKAAVGKLSVQSESVLKSRILKKIDPILYLYKEKKINKEFYNKAKSDLKTQSVETNKNDKLNSYDLTIYNVDIMDDLLVVLTKQDFIKYLEYIDLYQPLYDNNNKNTRSIFGSDILKKQGLIDSNDVRSFGRYIENILAKQGCFKSTQELKN